MTVKTRLMTPGPTSIDPEIMLEMARPLRHHRSDTFGRIFVAMNDQIRRLFRTSGDVAILTCSGTGAMEAGVVNLFSPGDAVLVLITGVFGDRFAKIARAYGMRVIEHRPEAGFGVRGDDVRPLLEAHPELRGVLMTQTDTSTGICNDVRSVAALTRERDLLIVVDAVSGLGVNEYDHEAWGVDYTATGSQKGIAVPPGLAFVAVSPRARARLEKPAAPNFYFNLAEAFRYSGMEPPQTSWTPNISVFFAAHDALKRIEAEGGVLGLNKKYKVLGEAARAAIDALGLEIYAQEGFRSNTVTGIFPPKGVKPGDLVRLMARDYGFVVAKGQVELENKIFRIGHIGDIDMWDTVSVFGALELTLVRLGHPVKPGCAMTAALAVHHAAAGHEGRYEP